VNRDDALMCSLCQALFRKVPPKLPPAVTGHAAWPRIQEHLDAARAAVMSERWDEARFTMDEALGLLPEPAAKALVVGLGRQWIAALRVDPATRARLNASLDRFRAALDENRFSDAAAEIQAATELTKDQVSDVMPIVAIGMRVLGGRGAASRSKARLAAADATSPPTAAGIKEGAEFTALAEEVVAQGDGPFFKGFGFVPDFSPASLVVLDAFMDSMWGTSGAAPAEESWDAPPEKQRMIAQFGSYLGETLRRLWHGEWKRDARGPMWTMVSLPDEGSCLPFDRVYRRMKNGRRDALYGLYQELRPRLGPPPGERESYEAHAERLRAHQGPLEAAEAAANLAALASGRDPFGTTTHAP
jgi:hypothetical protein